MHSKADTPSSSSSLSSVGSSTLGETLDTSHSMAAPELVLPIDITAGLSGADDADALELARDVAAMSQPEMSRWRWLAMAAPRETWRRDDEAHACENLASESCRVTFGLSVAGVSMPSLSLRVVADDVEAEASASRSSLESRHTVASSSAETLASAHALSTPATSPLGHGHGYSSGQQPSLPFDSLSRPRRLTTSDWASSVEHTALDTIDESDRATFARRSRKQLVVNRRHHCRRCAGIFCERHSSHRATLLMERGNESTAPVTPGAIDGITAWWRSLPPAIASMGSLLNGAPRKATTVPASPISPTPSALLDHRNRPLLERRGRASTGGNVTAEVASASVVRNPQTPRSEAGTATVEEAELRASSDPTHGASTSWTIEATSAKKAQSLPESKRAEAPGHQRRRSSSLARLHELKEPSDTPATEPLAEVAAKLKQLHRGTKLSLVSAPHPPRSSLDTAASQSSTQSKKPPSLVAFHARVCDQCWLLLERAKTGMELGPRPNLITDDSLPGPSRAPSLASSSSSLRRNLSSTSLAAQGGPPSSGRGPRNFTRTQSLTDGVDDEETEHALSIRRVRDEKRREIRSFRRSLKQTVEARLRECASASGAPSSREPSPDGRMARARARRRRDEEQRAMDEVSHRMAAILAAGPSVGAHDSDGSGSSSEESEDEQLLGGPVEADDLFKDTNGRRSLADSWQMPGSKRDAPRSRMLSVDDLAGMRSSLRDSPVSSPSPNRSRPGRRLGVAEPSQGEEREPSTAKSISPLPGLMGRERLRRAFEYQIKHAA